MRDKLLLYVCTWPLESQENKKYSNHGHLCFRLRMSMGVVTKASGPGRGRARADPQQRSGSWISGDSTARAFSEPVEANGTQQQRAWAPQCEPRPR